MAIIINYFNMWQRVKDITEIHIKKSCITWYTNTSTILYLIWSKNGPNFGNSLKVMTYPGVLNSLLNNRLITNALQSFYTLNKQPFSVDNPLLTVRSFKGIIKFWNMPSYLHGSIEVRSRIIFYFIHTCRILPF